MSPIRDATVSFVLARFGVPVYAADALGNHGGFSGARVWRVTAPNGDWCLKAWPPGFSMTDQLTVIHRLMRRGREAGLAFVPELRDAPPGESSGVEAAGRCWDLTTWLSGRADFHDRPTAARMEAACTALARLHHAWRPARANQAVCPAVERRLRAAAEWDALVRSGWQPDFATVADAAVAGWAERSWVVLGYTARRVPDWLAGWWGVALPLQPCLCDVWHDHVLFTGDTVSGLVDYGSVKPDHVTVDLARMLGSLAGDDADLRAAGLDAYHRAADLSTEERALVDVLDRTGTVLSLANWLRWLFYERRQYDDWPRVARRLEGLVSRIESW
jgi:Ser/Thr protein kinase RdoA (MazF antagonist)